ncbi:MAG: hypothetical protein DI536_04160 [Archangium gephyra]|uniref:Uncharacterized protein n=1 Tax=Archangium gephyra TaxID=48 RepID=A0A2W5VP25_9BACT|nr:MAG: hypothetical protein DI536_04160 [Archangium gephyra]
MAATKRKRQTELPGIEKPSHPELNTLLEEKAALDTQAGEIRQRQGELNESILAKARELKLTTYRDDNAVPPLVLTISDAKAKVKVAKAKATVETDEATGGDE